MDDSFIGPENVVTAIYALAALSALAACWLLFRFNIRRERRRNDGGQADLLGLSEALTATALALGLAGFGFLLSIW
jgi:hypothetical protein